MSTPGAPIPLTASDISKITQYLDTELEEALAAHRIKEEKLDRWQDAYDGRPPKARKDFPWPGACNVVIPLIGIAVDSIVARIVNTLFAPEPFWSIRPIKKETELIAKPIEDFLEWSRINEFNMYNEVRKWVPEVVKFGWGYMKVPWRVQTNRTFDINDEGEAVPKDEVIRIADPHHVPIRDIITQAGVEDEINQAEFLGHRLRMTDGQLRWREHDGIYADVDNIIDFKEGMTESESVKLSRVGEFTPKQKLNTIYELHANIPPFGNSRLPENLTLTYHRPRRKLLRAIYSSSATGRRPFVKAKFIEREGELEGQGISARLADLQAEITTIHQQQVDNATLANTRFFLGRKGVIRPNTKVWPGRWLTVPDPEKDVKVMAVGEVYQSMARLSTEILAFSERASGVSDPFLGRESSVVGTRATATGTLAILQEGNRRFDLNVRDIRDALGEVGKIVLELNQQFRPEGVAFFVQGEQGELTEKALDLPREFLLSRVAVELSASTATINRSVEQQGLISLLGLLGQYYQQILQIGFLMSNQQLPEHMRSFMQQMLDGAQFVMRRLLQTFDVKNIDAVLPTFMLEVNQSNGPIAGAVGTAGGGNSPFGGMEGLLGSFGGSEGAGGAGGVGP
jgi:hypothetical protein